MALWDKPGAMTDGMYTLTTDHLTCNNISSHTSKESDGLLRQA